MKIIEKVSKYFKERENKNFETDLNDLLFFLKELKHIEANLWGVTINHLKNGEEEVLEDTNHLIYLISKNEHKEKIVQILKEKEINSFFEDLKNLKLDFNHLKKKIREKDKLKNLISKVTIKLVNPENYDSLENIFLLEKKLYEVIEIQDLELENFLKNISKVEIKKEEKLNIFLNYLKEVRKILAGNQDLYYLFEEERAGYSITSNILHELIKLVNSNFKTKIEKK